MKSVFYFTPSIKYLVQDYSHKKKEFINTTIYMHLHTVYILQTIQFIRLTLKVLLQTEHVQDFLFLYFTGCFSFKFCFFLFTFDLLLFDFFFLALLQFSIVR